MGELLSQLGIDLKLLIAQAVNFGIVAGVLVWFVFRPLMSFLEKRNERIKEGLEMRENAEGQLQRAEQERHRQLEDARAQADEILAQARADAAKKEQEVMGKVREEAEQVIAQAKEDASRERQAMMRQAKEEIVQVAFLVAERAAAASIGEEGQRRMRQEVADALTEKTS